MGEPIPNVGYRPKDNAPRWDMIRPELLAYAAEAMTCLEAGSNFGYFSLRMAQEFPAARVFSIEGSFGTGNEGSGRLKGASEIAETEGVQKHVNLRDGFDLWNNIVCSGVASDATYERLMDAGLRFDYQLSLSVFHWIVDASQPTSKSSRRLLADHLRVAHTTFLELPSMEQETALPQLYEGYASIPEAIDQACREHGVDVRITRLGSSLWYGTRDTLRVDVISDRDYSGSTTGTCDVILSALDVRPAAASSRSTHCKWDGRNLYFICFTRGSCGRCGPCRETLPEFVELLHELGIA